MTDRAMAPFHFAQITNTLAGDGAAKDAGGLPSTLRAPLHRSPRNCKRKGKRP